MKALIAIIAISLGLAGHASAQNATDVHPMSFAALVGTPENAAHLTDPASTVSVQKVQSAKMAQNAMIADSMTVAAQKLVTDHSEGSTELLRSGSVLELSTTMGGVHSALEQHSITVHVTYDARPVGGILNIRVDLVPVFGGIGSAVRPTISKQFAEAVENFDDDFISQTIMQLTNALATELASNE